MLFMILSTSRFLTMTSGSIGFRELNFREKTKKSAVREETGELLQHDNALKTLTDEVRHKVSSLTEA